MDPDAQAYVDAIAAEHRPLFDRVHRLIVDLFPGAEVVIAYKMPTYVVGGRRLHVAVWKHGLSMYGWDAARDAGFSARHPELSSDRGTLRLTPQAAAGIPDDELRAFLRATLEV